MEDQKDDWFTNVENLKPLRGGRRAKTLNSVAKNAFHVTNKEAEDKFRNDWEMAKQSDDPLEVLWQYSVWFDEHFPSGKPQLYYPMLYKICITYGSDERYQHDERILKFWIMLAENFPERGLAVFDFAYNRGSCNTFAKFYVRWSEMFDILGNSNKAREILEFGLKNRAVPITVINEAQNKLEMRLMRDTLRKQKLNTSNHEEQDMDYEDDSYMPSTQRKNLAKLKGVGEKSEAPMFRIPDGDAGTLHLPQTNIHASFEIFEDDPEPPQTPVTIQQKTGRLEDEFANDPDYQALFGFFSHKSRVDIHLNISENIRKPSSRLGLSDLPSLPTDNDEFEVFVEEPKSQNVLGDKKCSKTKLCLRKEVCKNELSTEEMYAKIVDTLRSL